MVSNSPSLIYLHATNLIPSVKLNFDEHKLNSWDGNRFTFFHPLLSPNGYNSPCLELLQVVSDEVTSCQENIRIETKLLEDMQHALLASRHHTSQHKKTKPAASQGDLSVPNGPPPPPLPPLPPAPVAQSDTLLVKTKPRKRKKYITPVPKPRSPKKYITPEWARSIGGAKKMRKERDRLLAKKKAEREKKVAGKRPMKEEQKNSLA